ncbi:MAG: hypothetical protein IJL41_02495 [Clostridia bacterium]|nr:hypothetical protein [Clostridia bacterium]
MFYLLFIMLAGFNFIFELATSVVLIPPTAAALLKSLEKRQLEKRQNK